MKFLLLFILPLSLIGCKTTDDNLRRFGKDYDVTGSVAYQGSSVTIGRVNGRKSINVNVDPKTIIHAVNK